MHLPKFNSCKSKYDASDQHYLKGYNPLCTSYAIAVCFSDSLNSCANNKETYLFLRNEANLIQSLNMF